MNARFAVIQFMWPFVRPYWRRIAIAMFGLALAAASVLAIGEGLKRVIDRGFAAGSAGELDKINNRRPRTFDLRMSRHSPLHDTR